ncbi:MAG: glycoside hydrolase family 3 N-terminal domain-containing protein [Bacteroidales bacterium]
MRFLVAFFAIFILPLNAAIAQNLSGIASDTSWVDSVFKTMTPYERIAQLFMIKVSTTGDEKYFDDITQEVCKYKVGGVAFFKGGPVRQANLVNRLQQDADVPLLVAIDGEWGLAMRLDSTPSFPRQITLGAIQNDSLIYRMGAEIARECKRLGIQMNFAPVVDVNSNPKNPVINSRSFGENKNNVAEKGLAYMLGMQKNGLLTCAKHFPGHGDTDIDSHLELPVIHHSREMIDTLDLFPFKKLIENDVSSVMVAHLNVPSLDSAKKSISSLSKVIVTGMLKNQLGFKGLVISDALDMKGVSKTQKGGLVELDALLAGIDMLLLPQDLPEAINKIKKAVDSSLISQDEIDNRCKKILHYKQLAGLQQYKPVEVKGLYEDLNSGETEYLQYVLYENAITLVKNANNILPFKRLDTLCLASLSIGNTITKQFQKMLSCYAPVDQYNLSKYYKKTEADSILKILKNYSYVIVGIHNTTNLANLNFGITRRTIDFIDSLKKQNKIILDIFANPYALSMFKNTGNIDALIISYQNNPISEELSAQLIFGAISSAGKLPVTGSPEFPVNTGILTEKPFRLKYTNPQELNVGEKDLSQIDTIALKGIKNKAYPGCVILVAKDGKVFYNKAFGYHTYDNKIPMTTSDIFDMASVTKVEASTMAIMKLVDEGKLDIDKHLGDYLQYLKGTNKEHILIRDLLAHQAKLKAWIPFYKETIINGSLDTNIYRKIKSNKYPFRVADSLYIRKDYPELIIQKIINSPLNKKKEYLYSDIGFYLMMKIIEKISEQSFESYLQKNFYNSLGMSNTGFRPYEKFKLSRIIPTEIDTEWRKQLLWGDVNDPGAAMMGGVCGHAGLFSNANDLATLLQMILQKGEYAGKRYLNPLTIEDFTKCQFPKNKNRRGLGFDKPALNPKDTGPCCKSASSLSCGHSGFTGTFFWVDPAEDIIYIFLSNRVYPDANNKKITEMGIRTEIQQVIYDAITKSKL